MLVRALCTLLFLALTSERNGDPLLYNGTWRSFMSVFAPLFDSVPGLHQPVWNLLLLALAPLCFFKAGAFRNRAGPMDAALLLSLGTLGLWEIRGILAGGSAYWSYYQLNALVLSLVTAALLLAAVRKPADLKALGTTVVAAALLRSLLLLYYFFAFVAGHDMYPPHMTSHDDSPLFAAAIVVLGAWALARGRWTAWAMLALALVPLLAAMKLNNRRVVWFELVLGGIVMYLMLPRGRMRRRLNRALLIGLPIFAVYAAIGWGRSGAVFAPLRAFGSTTGQTTDSSTLARHEENMNLAITFVQHPVIGSGWGQQFTSVSSYYAYFGGGFDELYRYTPHNSLLALVAFTGILGLIGTWGVVSMIPFLAARACRAAPDAVTRAAAMSAVAVVPVFGVHAFADIGLQVTTNTLLLAVAIAVAGRASVWTGAWPGGRAGVGRPPAAPRGPEPTGEPRRSLASRSDG